MGRAMLERLRDQGFQASGYDVLPALSECGSIRELCADIDAVLLSLPDGAAVGSAIKDIAGAARPNILVIDTSTDDPDTARRAESMLSGKGITFMDAPVSGGRAGVSAGTLSILIGGAEETLDKATPILEVLGTNLIHVGPVGSGQAAKLVNNFLVASHLASAREAVALGVAAGVGADALIEAVNRSSGRSAVTEVNYPRWILNGAFDSGFSTKLMRKDLREALALGERLGVSLPVGSATQEAWSDTEIADSDDFNQIAKL